MGRTSSGSACSTNRRHQPRWRSRIGAASPVLFNHSAAYCRTGSNNRYRVVSSPEIVTSDYRRAAQQVQYLLAGDSSPEQITSAASRGHVANEH